MLSKLMCRDICKATILCASGDCDHLEDYFCEPHINSPSPGSILPSKNFNTNLNFSMETSYDLIEYVQNTLRILSPLLQAQDIRALANMRTFDFGRG
jgi:hypothetical protein